MEWAHRAHSGQHDDAIWAHIAYGCQCVNQGKGQHGNLQSACCGFYPRIPRLQRGLGTQNCRYMITLIGRTVRYATHIPTVDCFIVAVVKDYTAIVNSQHLGN